MRFLLLLSLFLTSCATHQQVAVCQPVRCAPDEQFVIRTCSCELREDATQ